MNNLHGEYFLRAVSVQLIFIRELIYKHNKNGVGCEYYYNNKQKLKLSK